jgi:predicted transcriptional regulator
MANGTTERVAIFSIQPRFASAIFEGIKQVEFRKTRLRSSVSSIIVYCSAPVQRVIGAFSITAIDYASPHELWHRYGFKGGITRRELLDYYGDTAVGAAILIGEVQRLPHPIKLRDLDARLRPPQSFQYAHLAMLEALSADLPLVSAVSQVPSKPTQLALAS